MLQSQQLVLESVLYIDNMMRIKTNSIMANKLNV